MLNLESVLRGGWETRVADVCHLAGLRELRLVVPSCSESQSVPVGGGSWGGPWQENRGQGLFLGEGCFWEPTALSEAAACA